MNFYTWYYFATSSFILYGINFREINFVISWIFAFIRENLSRENMKNHMFVKINPFYE